MRLINKFAVVFLLLVFGAAGIFAQETSETIVDEVIAQVNDEVVTLSELRREKDIIVEEFIRQGKTRDEAVVEANKLEGQLIANLITEAMLRQKAAEIQLDKSIEADVNQRLLAMVKENNLKSINDLYTVMRQQGADPELIKKSWRSTIMKQQVFFQLVDLVVYWETSDEEVKAYFDKNKEKFLQQASVQLSEIFLAFAGKNEAEVEALAKSITQRARNGEDFVALATQYSDRPDVAESKGVVGTFNVPELNEDIKTAIKGLDNGSVAEPIRWDIGMEIVRVDKFTAASTETNFDETRVRRAIMGEKAPAARVKFLNNLREDSYIKIRESYRGIVTPFMTDVLPTETETASIDN